MHPIPEMAKKERYLTSTLGIKRLFTAHPSICEHAWNGNGLRQYKRIKRSRPRRGKSMSHYDSSLPLSSPDRKSPLFLSAYLSKNKKKNFFSFLFYFWQVSAEDKVRRLENTYFNELKELRVSTPHFSLI